MKKTTFILTLALLAMSLLSSCGKANIEDTPEPAHVVMVLGATENTPVINIEAATDLIQQYAYGDSTLSLIVADGQPYLYEELTISPIDPGLSASKCREILKQRIEGICAYAEGALAVSPHADYLGAITMASRILQGYNDGYEKHLLVFGSMLSDVAPLDMTVAPLENYDRGPVVESLLAGENIPVLEGCQVSVFNAGDTALPQKPLSNVEKKALTELWTDIFEAGNPESVTFSTALPSELLYEGLPEVKTVPVLAEAAAIDKAPAEPSAEAAVEEADAISFTEETIAFQPGTDQFLDEAAAAEAITAVSAYMNENPEIHALLLGTVAHWGEEDAGISLSYARAAAVQQLFAKAGVAPDRLQIVGGGWLTCFYKDDQAEDGSLNEEVAAANRSTIWMEDDSPLAELVLQDEDADKFLFG